MNKIDALLGLFCVLGILWIILLTGKGVIKIISISIENRQCQQTLQQLIKEQL